MSPTFIHAYSGTPQDILVESNVVFDNALAITGNCGILPNSTDIWVWEAGFYYVSYNLHHIQPCQFSLFKNDVVMIGSISSSPTGATICANQMILEILPEDLINITSLSPSGFGCKIQLRNHTSFAPVVSIDGSSGAGSALPDISANLSLVLLKSLTV